MEIEKQEDRSNRDGEGVRKLDPEPTEGTMGEARLKEEVKVCHGL